MVFKKIISSPIVVITVLVTSVAVIFRFSPKLLLSPQQRLFTAEELALHNGTDESIPILLGILGSVFDVTKGKSHYGVGGGYNHFAGRDASCAFVSGNFTGDGLTDSLRGLSSTEVKSIVEWREFYFRSYMSFWLVILLWSISLLLVEQQRLKLFGNVQWQHFFGGKVQIMLKNCGTKFVGKLVGRYYDNQGNPTKYLKGAEAKSARGAQLLEKQKAEEAKQPGCNSRWSQDEGGEVWCDNGFPRLVQRPVEIALTGKMSKRCACFLEDQLDQPGLEVYEGCDYLAQTCRV